MWKKISEDKWNIEKKEAIITLSCVKLYVISLDDFEHLRCSREISPKYVIVLFFSSWLGNV